MKLTEAEVRYVANLANLNLTAPEIDLMVHDLGSILEHMDRLAGIDTEGVFAAHTIKAGFNAEGFRER